MSEPFHPGVNELFALSNQVEFADGQVDWIQPYLTTVTDAGFYIICRLATDPFSWFYIYRSLPIDSKI